MITVSFSKNEITVKRVKKTPPKKKDITGVDGITYNVVVPKSSKTIVEFTYTHKGILEKNELPDDLLNNFSETERDLIFEKQKIAIQTSQAKNMQECTKQIDTILDYKDFIEAGPDVEMLANKVKELQLALKKK